MYRLHVCAAGQIKQTHIIRLIADNTVEQAIIKYQQTKRQNDEEAVSAATARQAQLAEAELLAGNTLVDLMAMHP